MAISNLTRLSSRTQSNAKTLSWFDPRWSTARDLKKLAPLVFGVGPITRILVVSVLLGAVICLHPIPEPHVKNDAEVDCHDDALTDATAAHGAVPELDPTAGRRRRAKPWESSDLLGTRQQDLPPPTPRIHRRWDRLSRLVGEPAMHRLLHSHVTVFGLGGVGSYVVEALARSAVGRLSLVDFDDVCVTNVNRQLQAFPGTIGQSKAALMADRARAIHPEAWIDPLQVFYDQETADALLTPRPDFVVDAIDNVTAKVHLLTTCLDREIPVVSVTGSGARLDPTQVRIADLSQTRIDPLARIVRKQLAQRGVDTRSIVGLPVVYSEEEVRDPVAPSWDEATGFRCICPHREDSPHACEKRRIIYGTAGFVTAAFGMAAASVVVRSLTEERQETQANVPPSSSSM